MFILYWFIAGLIVALVFCKIARDGEDSDKINYL